MIRRPLTDDQLARTLERHGVEGDVFLLGIRYTDERTTVALGREVDGRTEAAGVYVVPEDVLAEPGSADDAAQPRRIFEEPAP